MELSSPARTAQQVGKLYKRRYTTIVEQQIHSTCDHENHIHDYTPPPLFSTGIRFRSFRAPLGTLIIDTSFKLPQI